MKQLFKTIFILALILCFTIPAFAIKILPYNVPLQDLMRWDKYSATLKLSNPEGETLTISWPTTVDLWNYDGDTWTFNLPSGDTFAFSKAITGTVNLSETVAIPEKTPVNAVASVGKITSDTTAPSDGDTVTIDTKVYTFKTALTPTEGEILIGGTAAAALDNLLSAINHTGTPDTDYKCAAVHPTVTATTNTDTTQLVAAKTKGVAGDLIALAEDSDHLVVDAATLGTEVAGVDGTVGVTNEIAQDASYLYVCIAANTIADNNWRRVSIGSAY